MIAFEEALHKVLSSAKLLTIESVPLQSALNRVLALDVFSDMDMPPFNKSAVDGYACRKEDLLETLSVIEVIKAGKSPSKSVQPGQCSKIMTGAMLPEGADLVMMVEDTVEDSTGFIRFNGLKSAVNICFKAEDLHEEDKVLDKGTLIKPSHIAVLASVGCAELLVYRQPVVAVLSTGDELVEPNQIPGLSQIRNTNAAQLIAQIENINAVSFYPGIVPDDEEVTRKAIEHALSKADVVLLTGGVSMGDFDFVPRILKEQQVEIIFSTIAVQPGKPTVFGYRNGKYVFGLPGNPVSSFVQFEMLVKPLLYALSGHEYHPLQLKLPLAKDYSRRSGERRAFIPITIQQTGEVTPVEYHGSAHIQAYAYADGVMSVPTGITQIKKGDLVDVRPL